MKIDTNDWFTLKDACVEADIPQVTGYRLAKRLGIVKIIFGIRVVRKKDVQKMVDNRKRVGNPVWIESYEEAAESALRAVESRKRRLAEFGQTPAEAARNKKLADAGTAHAKARAAKREDD